MATSERRPSRVSRWLRALGSPERFDAALRLTALDLLLRPVGGPRLRPGFLALAALLLLVPACLRARWLWALLAMLAAARLVADWPFADNHAYLLAYWCLAVTLALGDADPDATLAESARWLVGLAFAFAVLWKGVLSPEFADGRFLQITILTDPRLDALAPLASGLSPAELAHWRDWIGGFVAPAGSPGPVPDRLRAVATLATAWTLVIESAVACAFLARDRWRLARARDVSLLVFCTTTYAVLPVTGFGWLLLALGAAQSPARPHAWRVAYLAAFAWVGLCAI